MNTMKIPNEWLRKQVSIHVVGAGGTGSQVIKGLAKLDMAIRALGHPEGVHITVWDDDIVSRANIGRQEFYECDIGLSKATVLVHRINLAMGLDWSAKTVRYGSEKQSEYRYSPDNADLVIGCVDSRTSRKAILETAKGAYWLDLGNRAEDGQCILGQIPHPYQSKAQDRLPHVADLFPEIVNQTLDQVDDGPSCSLADALEKQALFINSLAATWGLNLLWQLFRHGEISHHGIFFDARTGRSNPLSIDSTVWRAMGYKSRSRATAKGRKKVVKLS